MYIFLYPLLQHYTMKNIQRAYTFKCFHIVWFLCKNCWFVESIEKSMHCREHQTAFSGAYVSCNQMCLSLEKNSFLGINLIHCRSSLKVVLYAEINGWVESVAYVRIICHVNAAWNYISCVTCEVKICTFFIH